MRWYRFLLAGGVTAALLLPSAAVAEGTRVTLDDMTCTGIGVMGAGLPAGTPLDLALVNRDNNKNTVMTRKTVRTSAQGRFATRMEARLNRVLSLRVLVSTKDGKQIAFGDHVMRQYHAMCGLPFTGPGHAGPTLLASLGSVGLGVLLVVAASRRSRATGTPTA
ncbi:MAG TPA: hypothetical protein VG276_04890 [Actinomycetes bacterium]|jgi:hypothetical protein|nr:hypothetical protein [Actinomycetes bacterium]